MKHLSLLLFVVTLSFLACQKAEAPAGEPMEEPAAEEPAEQPTRGTAQATIGGAEITIDYGRPELKGRDMLAELEDGQVWRLGMNEATKIETSKDLRFGETTLQSGSYSMFAKKLSADEWHVILNSEADISGTRRNPDNDVTEVSAEVEQLEESVEQFTIEVVSTGEQGGEILMKWATLQLKVPFSVAAHRL